jgi:hypothetical protein
MVGSKFLKVKNCPYFLVCKWSATYLWKDLDEGYNFASDLITIGGLHTKLWPWKVVEVSTLTISGLTKCNLDVSLVERHIVYYKGEGGSFPQVRAVVSLVSPILPVVRPNTKSAPVMHWPTCCLVLCKSVWVNKCLSFFLVLSQSSSMPLYPPKVLWAKECAPTLDFFIVFTLDSHLSLSKSLRARHCCK